MAHRFIEKFVKKLGNHPTITIGGANSPLLMAVPWSKNPALPPDLVWASKQRGSLFIFDEYAYHQICESRLRDYLTGKVSKQELEADYQSYARDSLALYNEVLALDLKEASEAELIALLERLIPVWERIADTVYIESLNYEIALRALGKEKQAVLDAVWEQATHPTFLSFDGRRLAYLIDLLEHMPLIEAVTHARYVYTDYYWSKPDNEIRSELETLLDNLTEKKAELATLEDATAHKKSEYEKWATTLSTEEKKLADFIQMVMEMRDIRKDPIAQTQAALVLFATELLARAGIDAEHGTTVTMYEIARGVAYLESIADTLVKRSKGSIFSLAYGEPIAVELCDYDEAVAEIYALSAHEALVTEIRGQVASKGKVTGTARVVLDPHDDKGFMQGDILVTSMTRPEFVPLMKLAGAVVTNEGGITCHAAIVSRELNIPCVIGTKIATQALHDGDLVEVDAVQGVVRIVTKSTQTV